MKKVISLIISIAMIFGCFCLPSTVFAASNTFGYDISHNNGVLDSKAAKENGKSFVMIRLGYSTNHIDRNFWDNVKNAYENEMPFGVYFYSYAYNDAEAKEDADFVLETLSRLGEYAKYFTLPVAYDLEDDTLGKLGKSQVTKQMTIFCDAIQKAGYVPMVYANTYWFNSLIDSSVLSSKGYKLWYAYYPSGNPDFSSKMKIGSTGLYADMWQYKSGDAKNNILDENVVYDINALSHICNWKVSKTDKATQSDDGKITYKCSVCGKTKASTIYKIKTVTLSTTSYTYDGKVKKPSVTVKDSKGNKIASSNYSVAYQNGRKSVGKYSVKITFKGNYRGSETLYFTINPKATALSSVTAKSKGFTVKWKKQAAQTTGYEIQYATDSKFTKNKKTVTVTKNSTTSKTISKLSAKKKYYVRVRTYKTVKVNGKNTKVYSSWSKPKTVTTKK